VRVVIADDSSIPRDILRQVMKAAGYEVVAACANGAEALDAAKRLKPDAVVVDISMPVMNGDVCAKRAIAEITPRPKVVVCSSAGQDAIRKPLQALGIRFVSKPYNKDRFLSDLQAALAEE